MKKILYLTRIIPDRIYLQLMYFKHFHKFIDFKHPISFNEKLQYLKIFNRKPEYTQMVDKYLVKDYVAKKIGEKYIIPTLEKWNNVSEIDISVLPEQFVLKCNNDSGGIVICKSKKEFNEQVAKTLLKKRLNNNGFWYGREWPYKNMMPCIIAEKYLSNSSGKDLIDYKVHVFNGVPRFILVCEDRYSAEGIKETFYTPEWKKMPVKRPDHNTSDQNMERPDELDEILELSKILAEQIPFLRVDFYILNHKVYFGELTFYPASGFCGFNPNEWDQIFGTWLDI